MRRSRGAVLLIGTGLLGALALWLLAAPPGLPQDRDPGRALPPGPLRLTVMGTSLTARYDWPERLAAALGACLGHEVALARVARSGAASDWGLTQAGAVVATAPDILLVEFAINDADLLDGMPPVAAADTHRRLVAALRADLPDTVILLLSMNPAQGLRGLIRPRLGRHYADLRALAAAADIGLADLYPRWLARPRAARGLQKDGLHPDPEVAADVILPPVLALLGRAAGADCSAY